MRETAAILARVSSKAQEDEGYSLDAQVRLLSEYCTKNGFDDPKVFRIAETASKEEARKTFNKVMSYLTKHKVSHLVVEKTDRLTRNFKDAVAVDEWLDKDDKRRVHFAKESYQLHKESKSHEKFIWAIRVAVAKNFTDNLREEVRKGQIEKLSQGWLPGTPPLGYMTVGQEGKRVHVHDPQTAPIVQKLLHAYLEPNHSINSIALLAEELGLRTRRGRPLIKSSIHLLLRNPFYMGKNRWMGIDYPGAQKPLISKETHDAIIAKMTGKKAPLRTKHNPIFKGLFKCSECSSIITWERQKGRFYGKCNGYRGCTKKRYAREDLIEQKLMEVFDRLVCPSPAIIEWVQGSLQSKHQLDLDTHTATVTKLQNELDRIRRQQHILYQDRLCERIDLDFYESMSESLKEKESDLKDNIDRADEIAQKQFEEGMNILRLSQEAALKYVNKPPEVKRTILCKLFSNLVMNGNSPLLELTVLAQSIEKRVEETKSLIDSYRTAENNPDNGGGEIPESLLRPIWQGLRDDFRTILVTV